LAIAQIHSYEIAIATDFGAESGNWLVKAQAEGRPPPPRAMVLRGSSPETDRLAALFASTGLFDVFIAHLDDTVASSGERIDVDNSAACHSDAKTLSLESVKLECIRRTPPGPLPDCSLGIDLRGPPNSGGLAQRAWIYAMLNHGEPCPFYDSLVSPSSKSLRPWAGTRPVAKVDSPTPRSILQAIGIAHGAAPDGTR
jgi:hypothetical protein